MGILDDVVVNAKSAAQTVGKMAGQFVDMSKLRINLSELNGEINRRYQELGQYIYETQKAGKVDEAEVEDKIAGIDELYTQFAAVSAQLAALQNKITCPGCGKQMDADATFCSHCGMKLGQEERAAAPEAAACAEPEEAAPAEAPAEETTEEKTED